MVPSIRLIKPDILNIQRFELTAQNNVPKWTLIYQRFDNMDSVSVRNIGGMKIFISSQDNPKSGAYDELDAGDWWDIDTDVQFLYARASSPATPMPSVIVKIKAFSPDRLRDIAGLDTTKTIERIVESTVRDVMVTHVQPIIVKETESIFQMIMRKVSEYRGR